MSEPDINSVVERMSLEQTRGCDHDPCHEGGEAREQQQIMQDDGHKKSSYAAPSNRGHAQSNLVAKATRQESRSKSFRLMAIATTTIWECPIPTTQCGRGHGTHMP